MSQNINTNDKARDQELLYQTIKSGDNVKVKNLLEDRVDPNFLVDGKSYLQIAIEHQNMLAVPLLVEYGADPNIGVFNFSDGQSCFSTLDMVTGKSVMLPKNISLAKFLIQFGATHGGLLSHGLSKDEKHELDQEREHYLIQGEREVIDLKIDMPFGLERKENDIKFDIFLKRMKEATYPKIYNKLDSYSKILVNKEITSICENLGKITAFDIIAPNKVAKVKHFVKSFGGLKYTEPSPQKEIHSSFQRIKLILETHADLLVNKEANNSSTEQTSALRDISHQEILIGEHDNIGNLFE